VKQDLLLQERGLLFSRWPCLPVSAEVVLLHWNIKCNCCPRCTDRYLWSRSWPAAVYSPPSCSRPKSVWIYAKMWIVAQEQLQKQLSCSSSTRELDRELGQQITTCLSARHPRLWASPLIYQAEEMALKE